MKMGYALAASLLLAGPAWAGNDFCDAQVGGGGQSTGPIFSGGGCEVSLTYAAASTGPSATAHADQLRDLWFDPALLNSVSPEPGTVEVALGISGVKLGSEQPEDTESGIAEWTFEPNDKSAAARMLALSLRREGQLLVLVADWLRPPGVNWSAANQSVEQPILLDSRSIKLGTIDDFFQPYPYMRQVGSAVYFGARHEGEVIAEFRFDLPAKNWSLVHLRNGFLRGSGMQSGMKVHLSWPVEFLHANFTGPNKPSNGPAPPPVAMPVQPPTATE